MAARHFFLSSARRWRGGRWVATLSCNQGAHAVLPCLESTEGA